jgi:hypothetical protein
MSSMKRATRKHRRLQRQLELVELEKRHLLLAMKEQEDRVQQLLHRQEELSPVVQPILSPPQQVVMEFPPEWLVLPEVNPLELPPRSLLRERSLPDPESEPSSPTT